MQVVSSEEAANDREGFPLDEIGWPGKPLMEVGSPVHLLLDWLWKRGDTTVSMKVFIGSYATSAVSVGNLSIVSLRESDGRPTVEVEVGSTWLALEVAGVAGLEFSEDGASLEVRAEGQAVLFAEGNMPPAKAFRMPRMSA